VGVGIAVGDGVGVSLGVGVGVVEGVGDGVAVAVGVGVGAVGTTLKVTVIEAPLLPVPPIELHGVATREWLPNEFGVHV
jgi:hypothetical protein